MKTEKNPRCPEIQIRPVEECCHLCPPELHSGFIVRLCGQRKNLRGVKRRLGDVWQLPKGFVCYTPTGWVKMEVNKVIESDVAIMIKDKEETL